MLIGTTVAAANVIVSDVFPVRCLVCAAPVGPGLILKYPKGASLSPHFGREIDCGVLNVEIQILEHFAVSIGVVTRRLRRN